MILSHRVFILCILVNLFRNIGSLECPNNSIVICIPTMFANHMTSLYSDGRTTPSICMTSLPLQYNIFSQIQKGKMKTNITCEMVIFPEYKLEQSIDLSKFSKVPHVNLKLTDVSSYKTPTMMCLKPSFNWIKSISCLIKTHSIITDLSTKHDMFIVSVTVQQLKWSDVLLIYDSTTEEQVSELHSVLSKLGITAYLMNFDKIECGNIVYKLNSYYEELLGRDPHLNTIVMCSSVCTNAVLHQANQFSRYFGSQTAFYQKSNWLITSPVIDVCGSWSLQLDNVALFKSCALSHTADLHLLMTSMDTVKTTLNSYRAQCLKSYNNCFSSFPVKDRQKFIHNIYTKLKNTVSNRLLSIQTLMWAADSKREFRHVGYVDKTKILNPTINIFPNRKFGFNKRKLTVSTNPWPPFVFKKIVNSKVFYYGFCIDLLQELATDLNFSFTLSEPKDKEWGTVKNGNWTGLVGELARQEVDLVVAPLGISTDREGVMDFSQPYYYERSGIALKRPDPNATKWRRLLDPLTWPVLVSIWVSFAGISIILVLMERFNPYYSSVRGMKHSYLRNQVQNKIWYFWGALLSHGGHPVVNSSSGRVIVGCWWLFCIVMAATYSGNLIAFLTVSKDKSPFSNLAELIKNEDYRWGIAGGTFYVTLFKNSEREEYRKVWKGITEFNKSDPRVLDLSTDVHLSVALEGNYAYIGEFTPIELWQGKHCDIITIKENFFPVLYGLGLPDKSAFTLLFSDKVLKIYESGLLNVWKQRWWPNITTCSGVSQTQVKAVDLLSLQSAFYVAAIGLGLASMSLVVENVTKYINKCMVT